MANKHIVTCVACGKRFDANRGGYYNKHTMRYTCKSCGKAQKKAYKKQQAERKADDREKQTGMRQSMGAMIAKIACGILFVLTGFSSPESGWTFGYFLTALVIGAAFIAWGVLPYLNAKKRRQAENVPQEEISKPQSSAIKTCASCGALGKGPVCEYCGRELS